MSASGLKFPGSRHQIEQPEMSTSRLRWSWIAFTTGLVVGIPLGAFGLIVLMQMLTVVISP
jgi:hypothetical protein